MKLLKLLLPIVLVIFTMGHAQETNYNLPPGFQLKPNYQVIDLSFKLEGKDIGKDYLPQHLQVLKDIPDSQLHETSPEYQEYVATGRAVLNSLPEKAKSIYREFELWYIYAFDTELLEKLKSLN